MHETLLSDVDTSIKFWYACYFLSNTVLLIASLCVIVLPILTGANVVGQKFGFLSAACGALLSYLSLGGVSATFIKARNDLQIAKYHYEGDKDRDKLIAAYGKAKDLASWVPATPSTADDGRKPHEPAAAQQPQKGP
jgi:hypothetical protein